jgi:hypothetical protein
LKKNFTKYLRPVFLATMLFACVGTAAAQGPVVADNNTTSELTMGATVRTAVRLELTQGSGALGLTANHATGICSLAFGNVNGLGLGTPAGGFTVDADAAGALYKTPISLTPIFSGFTTEDATIEVEQDATGDTSVAREGTSGISSSSTVSTTIPASVTAAGASGTLIERFVGIHAARTEAAGAVSVKLIYKNHLT